MAKSKSGSARGAIRWKWVLGLSLMALGMAIATVFWIPSNIEPLFWITIFLICAVMVATKARGRYFLHGFLIGLVNCVWVTGGHVLLSGTYLANHPQEAAMMAQMPIPDSPRLMMAVTGPMIGVISGVVIGLFCWAASKLLSKKRATA